MIKISYAFHRYKWAKTHIQCVALETLTPAFVIPQFTKKFKMDVCKQVIYFMRFREDF